MHAKDDITIGSSYRFKGRAVPCVMLTEIEFKSVDRDAVRRPPRGAARPPMKLMPAIADGVSRGTAQRKAGQRHDHVRRSRRNPSRPR